MTARRPLQHACSACIACCAAPPTRTRTNARTPPHPGFTLIEVLVALSIVAIALLAGVKATGALSQNAQRQSLSVLGQICADNELIRLRLQRQLPAVGNFQSDCPQAQHALNVRVQVQATPNPNFRRVDVRVLTQEGGAEQAVLQISTVVGSN